MDSDAGPNIVIVTGKHDENQELPAESEDGLAATREQLTRTKT